MKIFKTKLLIILIMLFCKHLKAENIDSLFREFKIKSENELLEKFKKIDSSKNNNWINFIPNIGYNYNPLDNSNSISIGFSLNNFIRNQEEKEKIKIQKEELKISLRLELNRKIEKIEIWVQELKNEIEIYKMILESFEIKKQLFEIEKEKYQKNKINLESFLKSKDNFINNKKQKEIAKIKIEEKRKSILREIKTQKV